MTRKHPQPESRGRLSRDRILGAALEFADANGVEALTMRDLAQGLGFEAMALYRHVASKDEILEGILDLVLDEVEPPPATGDWAAAVRTGAVSAHEALDRHPWAARRMMVAVRLWVAALASSSTSTARASGCFSTASAHAVIVSASPTA